MKLHLVVLSEGKAKGKKIPITLSQFLIGRDRQCHLRPASDIISKRHCAILVKENRVVVRDFNSTNGTFVNKEQVKNELELANDDILQVGPISFKIELEKPVSVTKPTPAPPSVSEGDDEEADVAAMLLSLQEGDDDTGSAGEEDVPAGTTMMDIPAMNSDTGEEKQTEDSEEKEEKEPEKTSSEAAEEILQKYQRRTRR